MRSLKLPYLLLSLAVLAFSCHRQKVRVVRNEYTHGHPETVDYFDTEEDAERFPTVRLKEGIGHADKPISFDEERYYENGKLQSRGRYIKGQTCGLWEYFYETGIPVARSYYDNGRSIDTTYCWYASGKLKRALVETDTAKNYWHCVNYFENGKKSSDSYMIKDSLEKWTIEGKYIEWHENGRPKLEAVFKNNNTVGKWQEWDDKGILTNESDKPFSITFE